LIHYQLELSQCLSVRGAYWESLWSLYGTVLHDDIG
jgi:hypothetical protein